MALASTGGITNVEPHKHLGEALLAFQEEADKLKLGRNEEGQIQSRTFKYLTLEKLIKEVRPALSKQGLVWSALPTAVDGKPALRYRLLHKDSREALEETMLLMLDAENPRGQGSAITYAIRYAMLSTLGLSPDDDDDGKAAGGDERLMVSRKLDADEQANMREAIAEAGLEVEDVLATIDAASIEDVTVAQGHQAKGILKLKGKASDG